MLAGIQSRDSDLKRALVERGAALKEADTERERFQFMAESMPQKIFTSNAAGETLYLNKQWMEFTGLPFDQIAHNWWVQLVHPDDQESSEAAWGHALATGEPLEVTNRLRRADGVYRWHLSRARAMRDGRYLRPGRRSGECPYW